MCTRIREFVIYCTIASFYLCDEKYAAAASIGQFVGGVRNLTVLVSPVQEWPRPAGGQAGEFLKLNVSWLPPSSARQPSSYSLIVTSVSVNGSTHGSQCPDGTVFYTRNADEKLGMLVPENEKLADLPDLDIRPGCSYRVQVIANPRSKYIANESTIIYTVPACIGHACNCAGKRSTLPIPRVNVTREEGNRLVVNWRPSFNASGVLSYRISLGVPISVSRKGLPIYNITRIGEVAGNRNAFLLKPRGNEQAEAAAAAAAAAEIEDGAKVFVAAIDRKGCAGSEGSALLDSTLDSGELPGRHIWFIPISIAICCTLFGLLSIAMYRKDRFLAVKPRVGKVKRIHNISNGKTVWRGAMLQRYNVLYARQDTEISEFEDETEKLRVPFRSVKLIRELGAGQFGKVYLGHLDDANATSVAVKMSREICVSVDSEIRQQFLKEIDIMRSVGKHPHLVSLVGYCVQPNKPVCILLEYMQGGDLLTYLHGKRKEAEIGNDTGYPCPLKTPRAVPGTRWPRELREYTNAVESWEGATRDDGAVAKPLEKGFRIGRINGELFYKFAIEIAMGMEHLESKGVTHRDLAARNILLGADSSVKVSDFGLSRSGVYVIQNIEEKSRHLPIRWMSPEALHSRSFSSKSDVWSFGVVLWEICTLGAFPYSNIGDDRLPRYIVYENGRLEQPENVPPNVYSSMMSCWASQPGSRPNFAQLLFDLRAAIVPSDDAPRNVHNPCYELSAASKAVDDRWAEHANIHRADVRAS